MTELHAGLELYRDQLRGAIAQQLENERKARLPGRSALKLAVPVVGAVAAGALAMTLTGGRSVQSADAAILYRVAAALTSPRGTILHERALVTLGARTEPYELWVENVAPYHYRVLKWGHEATGASRAAPDDWAAELRSLVQAGRAAVVGTTTIDGVAAYKLTVSGASDRFLNGTAYVSQTTYHPLLIDTTANGGERIAFQTYEYLPATPANHRQVNAAGPDTTAPARK